MGIQFHETCVLRFDNGGYYAGPNEKYSDMFNLSFRGALGAKKMDRDLAIKLRDFYSKQGYGVEIEVYNAREYLKQSLMKILKADEDRANGKDIGYTIRNNAQRALEYLEQI